MTKILNVAVCGVGHLGQHHARILAGLTSQCRLAAIVDPDRGRAERLAHQYGAVWYDHHDKLIERGDIDAASIAAPTLLHHRIAAPLLKNGIHCLVEKPITATVEDAEDLIRIADENKCVLQVGHIERFNAGIRKLREILDRPGFIECHRLGPFVARAAGVGVVLDLMIHDIDIVLQIVDSPLAAMDAVGVKILTDKEDIANVRLKFENGCTANLTVSRVSPKPQRKIRVFQKDTYVSIDYAKQSMELYKRVPRPSPKPGEPMADIVQKRLRLKREDMLTLELSDFLETVAKGGEPTVTGQHARDALHTAVHIARMIEEQQKTALFKEL